MTMCKLRARNPVAHQPKLFSAPSSAPPRRSSSLAGADLTRHARNVPQGQSRRETEPEREEKFRPREKATAPIHAEEGLSRPPRAWIIRDKYLRARGARCSFIGKRNAPAHDAACSRANRATRACRDLRTLERGVVLAADTWNCRKRGNWRWEKLSEKEDRM